MKNKFIIMATLIKALALSGCTGIQAPMQPQPVPDTQTPIEQAAIPSDPSQEPFEDRLYSKVRSVMDTWNEDGIYAVSFLVYSNKAFAYRGFSNVSLFSVSYNTKKDCRLAGKLSERRWNYAFWRQNETPIIDPSTPNALTDALFDWYSANGITEIGKEDEHPYDENMIYIGKGPVGHYELLSAVAETALRLQQENYLESRFGKKIPIIIHGLDYAWYDFEATAKANPSGEADTFFKAMKRLNFM